MLFEITPLAVEYLRKKASNVTLFMEKHYSNCG